MTKAGDLVLIYFEDIPYTFARIEDIVPDRKPGWNHVKFLFLQIPLQVVTWILRDSYVNGDEFTMDGKKFYMEKVVSPVEEQSASIPEPGVEEIESKSSSKGKVISFADIKKNEKPF